MKRLREKQEIDIDKLEDSTHLLDILIQCENVLDSLDLYCFLNWFDGEIIEGPIIRRHWVTISLLYPSIKMPDPRAALRLLKHGVQVEYSHIKRANSASANSSEPDKATDWMVTLTMPRRLLDQIDGVDLEMYDDEVNTDDVTAAKDIGLDDESQYQTDEQEPTGGDQGIPADPMQPPPMPATGGGNAPPPRQ